MAEGNRQDHQGPRRTLLAFYAFPAEHWVHLKTTNPIESTFATVRLRTKVTKGPGSRAAGLGHGLQAIQSAQSDGGPVNATHWSGWSRSRRRLREGGDGRAIRAGRN